MNSTYRLGDSGNSARAAVNQPTLTAEWEDRDYTGLVREPDAGNPPVRFDERGVETEYGHPTMPPRHTSTLLLIRATSPFLVPGRLSKVNHPSADQRAGRLDFIRKKAAPNGGGL